MSALRPLVLDDAAKAEAARVVAYAMDHPYRPRAGGRPPGDDPGHVAMLNTYRAVFSFTELSGATFRHLTVSVPGERYPNPAAAFAIADLFGFTGWDQRTIDRPPDSWGIEVKPAEHCVSLVQKIAGGAK